MDSSPGWFRRHFNEDYLILYSGRDAAQAEREAAFAARSLRLGANSAVLDLCCGFGRHLRAFARLGIRAAGVDLSPALLCRARGESFPLVCADMRRLPFPDGRPDRGFAALVNFFTSFGYFETDEENAEALREAARVLRPGGRFLLDLMNPDLAVPGLEPRSERRAGTLEIVEERRFDARRRRIEKRIQVRDLRTEEVRRYFESVRIFSAQELEALLVAAGLRIDRLFGDFDGSELAPGAPRLIVTGRRG